MKVNTMMLATEYSKIGIKYKNDFMRKDLEKPGIFRIFTM